MFRFFWLILVVSLAGCGFSNRPESQTNTDSGDSLLCSGKTLAEVEKDAFTQTVWPATQQSCVLCHSGGFASSDVEFAFFYAAPLLRGNPPTLQLKASDGHCGSSECIDNAEMQEAVAAYLGAVALAQQDSACDSTDASDNTSDNPPPEPPKLATGQQVYERYCMACHRLGAFDTSGRAPDLEGKASDVSEKFADGKTHQKLTLTQDEIDLLVVFIGTGG